MDYTFPSLKLCASYLMIKSNARLYLILGVMFKQRYISMVYTVCPRSSDPFCIESYHIKRVTTSWTYSILHVSYNRYKDNSVIKSNDTSIAIFMMKTWHGSFIRWFIRKLCARMSDNLDKYCSTFTVAVYVNKCLQEIILQLTH